MGFCEVFLCARYCLNQLAWFHEMLQRHGPRAVLGLEQGLTILLLLLSSSLLLSLLLLRIMQIITSKTKLISGWLTRASPPVLVNAGVSSGRDVRPHFYQRSDHLGSGVVTDGFLVSTRAHGWRQHRGHTRRRIDMCIDQAVRTTHPVMFTRNYNHTHTSRKII